MGFGGDWTVTRGDVIGFIGLNFAILLFHTGGPKEDLWLNEVSGDYIQSLFLPANLGQYGISYDRFKKLMRCFELPTYGDATDPFEPIRKFTDSWNENMLSQLVPGKYITVDESMGLWRGKGMPGWLFVKCKPPSRLLWVGRVIRLPTVIRELLFLLSPTRGN